ncbi:cation:proton antiporter [Streptomyces sp. NPDC055607]
MMEQPHAEWIITAGIGDVALLLAAGTLFAHFARRLGQPAVIGEIVAGICLGPSLLGLLPGDLPALLFPADVRPLLSMVAQVGLLLFMFVIGWEFQGSRMSGAMRSTGSIWVCSMAFPLLLGAGLAALIYDSHKTVDGHHVEAADFGLYMAVAMSISAFPVLARIVASRGLQSSRVGVLALALAAADDVLAWCLLGVVVAQVTTAGLGTAFWVVVQALAFVGVMFALVRPGLKRLWPAVERSRHSAAKLTLIAAGALASAYATSVIGIHAIFGAFLFGLVMPRSGGDAALHDLRAPLERASRLLLPVYFVVVGLKVDLRTLTGTGLWQLALIIVVAVTGKLAGVAVAARIGGMSWRDATTLGLLMNTRGLTELVVLDVGLSLGVLSTQLFTMMVIMALVTTVMTGPLIDALRPKGRAVEEPSSEPAGMAG